jgi:MerR family mercuric resistance operon transcriptional regulator
VSNNFTIGDLSRLTGVSIEAIRYYERMNLLPHPPRTQGGHRAYSPDNLRTLAFIKRARELEFCLEDVRALLSYRGMERSCGGVLAIAARHLEEVRVKMQQFVELERRLADAVTRCPGKGSADCAVLDMLETGPSGRRAA